jgi:LL-diaminopimelate aminotransferase
MHLLFSRRRVCATFWLFINVCPNQKEDRNPMQASRKLSQIPPYLFAELDKKIDAARAEGRDIINLGIGDPDLPTPHQIVEAMHIAVDDKSTHNYPPYRGTFEYRKSAAEWMKKRFDVTIDPNTEALSLIGSKEGIAHLIMAYVDPGDVVLCPSPGYPVYRNFTILCGGEPYTVPLKAENQFLPDYTKIPAEVAQRAKLLFLNYPNNPTGAIASSDFIRETIAFCQKYNILLCHDNAYSEMTFDGYRAPSFLEAPGAKEVCIEMFSLSKMFNMTGWRVGFAVGNQAAVDALGLVKNNCDSGVFKAIQQASIVGLNHSDELLKDLNRIYAQRRTLFVNALNQMGWNFPPNVATFYLWIPVPSGYTDLQFVEFLLEKCNIVVAPGTGYGEAGAGFFRVALTQNDNRIEEAIQRMKSAGVHFQMAKKQPTAANA